jgi:hypothetical protein
MIGIQQVEGKADEVGAGRRVRRPGRAVYAGGGARKIALDRRAKNPLGTTWWPKDDNRTINRTLCKVGEEYGTILGNAAFTLVFPE